LTILSVTILADAMAFLIQQRISSGSVSILPCFLLFQHVTISADARVFLSQQRILCGSVGSTPSISAILLGDILVVAILVVAILPANLAVRDLPHAVYSVASLTSFIRFHRK
jgi:hypothetical protein